MTFVLGWVRERATARSRLVLGLGEAGEGEEFFVDDDEEALGTGEDGAVAALDFGLVEELAAFAAEVSADENERLVEGNWAKVVDFHVAGHGDNVEGAVELAHGFVEEGSNDAAMNVAGWAFVGAIELDARGCGGEFGIGVDSEGEVEALWVGGTTAEAMAGALVDGRIAVHGGRGVAICVG
jgi:hypothetical protein